MIDGADLFQIDRTIWLLSKETALPHYDFAFSNLLPTNRPYNRPEQITAVARIGAIENYDHIFQQLLDEGILLVHTPEEHRRCSELPGWYGALKELTPKSEVFSSPPSIEEIEKSFEWPVFLKGVRQTSKHQRQLSIIESREQYLSVLEKIAQDPILHWQNLVLREFINLRPVEDSEHERIPASFEFRCFFWRGQHVGLGPYWTSAKYGITESEAAEAINLATFAAKLVDVPFLVVDVGQKTDGAWIVIECNDGQESGYAGASRMGIWQKIIEIEKSN